MKRITGLAMATLLLVALAFGLDRESEFKSFAKKCVPNTAKALNAKNIKYFESVMTEDYTQFELDKTYNKKQTISEMKKMFASAKTIAAKLKLVSSSYSGNEGTTITGGTITVVMKPTKEDPKSHEIVVKVLQKEVWVKKGKNWKVKHIEQVKPPQMTMDGKPMKGT